MDTPVSSHISVEHLSPLRGPEGIVRFSGGVFDCYLKYETYRWFTSVCFWLLWEKLGNVIPLYDGCYTWSGQARCSRLRRYLLTWSVLVQPSVAVKRQLSGVGLCCCLNNLWRSEMEKTFCAVPICKPVGVSFTLFSWTLYNYICILLYIHIWYMYIL